MEHALLLGLAAAALAQDPVDPLTARLERVLPGEPAERRRAAFEELEREPDPRALAPLVDLLRFADTREEWWSILDAAGAVLGEDLRELERPWRNLTARLADGAPSLPPGYAGWKGELLARCVDPRYRELLPHDAASSVRLDEVVWGGVRVDGIPPLVDPASIPADEAGWLRGDEPVFGLALGGEARAYPLRVLDWHEMADDTLGGVPFALAYCTLCGAGIAYDRRVGERVLTFGTSGLLMRSNKLMYDRETRSLWNQMTGEPVIGELVGSGIELAVLPIVLTTWGAWRGRHPETSVLSLDTGHERRYELGAAYGDYFGSAETMFPVPSDADGATPKERVFVLRDGPRSVAFPLPALRAAGGVANHRVGLRAVVVVTDEPRAPRPLPRAWREALEGIASLEELDLEDVREVLQRRPELARTLSAEDLLALPTPARLELLEHHVAPALRDEVAVRALAGEVRAYERGEHAFRRVDGRLTDALGRPWRAEEDALVSPAGERLARLPGHLAYRFGWRAFHPDGEVWAPE